MISDARKCQNKSMMLYLKVKKYAQEGQASLAKLPDQKNNSSDKKKNGVTGWA